jgi:hypothetical protein
MRLCTTEVEEIDDDLFFLACRPDFRIKNTHHAWSTRFILTPLIMRRIKGHKTVGLWQKAHLIM